ncbi:hypothetical protein SGPA1_40581 [Streptomyces misionensis JCM 4497]
MRRGRPRRRGGGRGPCRRRLRLPGRAGQLRCPLLPGRPALRGRLGRGMGARPRRHPDRRLPLLPRGPAPPGRVRTRRHREHRLRQRPPGLRQPRLQCGQGRSRLPHPHPRRAGGGPGRPGEPGGAGHGAHLGVGGARRRRGSRPRAVSAGQGRRAGGHRRRGRLPRLRRRRLGHGHHPGGRRRPHRGAHRLPRGTTASARLTCGAGAGQDGDAETDMGKAAADIATLIAAERREPANFFQGLSPGRWEAPRHRPHRGPAVRRRPRLVLRHRCAPARRGPGPAAPRSRPQAPRRPAAG